MPVILSPLPSSRDQQALCGKGREVKISGGFAMVAGKSPMKFLAQGGGRRHRRSPVGWGYRIIF